MQYKIIDHRWQKLQMDEYALRHQGFDLAHLLEIEHNENLDLFEKQIQESIAEGWTPLGAPIFTEGWCKMDSGLPRRMYQAMVLHNNLNLDERAKDRTKEYSKMEMMLDEPKTMTSPIILPKLVPHPPSTKRNARSSSSSQINLKSPRTTRAERLRQEFMKQTLTKNN